MKRWEGGGTCRDGDTPCTAYISTTNTRTLIHPHSHSRSIEEPTPMQHHCAMGDGTKPHGYNMQGGGNLVVHEGMTHLALAAGLACCAGWDWGGCSGTAWAWGTCWASGQGRCWAWARALVCRCSGQHEDKRDWDLITASEVEHLTEVR